MSRVKELESRLEHTEQQLRLLQKISRFMVREMGLSEALQGVVSLVVEFMDCDSCLLYLLQDQELVLCASNNPQPDTIGKVRLKLGEGLTGWVARERRLLFHFRANPISIRDLNFSLICPKILMRRSYPLLSLCATAWRA